MPPRCVEAISMTDVHILCGNLNNTTITGQGWRPGEPGVMACDMEKSM